MSRVTGSTRKPRWKWLLPAISAATALVVGVFDNLLANDLEKLLGPKYRWIVWGTFAVASIITLVTSIIGSRRENEASLSSGSVKLNVQGNFSVERDVVGQDKTEVMAYVIRAYHSAAKLPENENELRGLYHSVLHGQRALLLLDNARDARQVEPLLPPSSCCFLVTSRQHFTLPCLFAKKLKILPPEDARKLLSSIAPRVVRRPRPLPSSATFSRSRSVLLPVHSSSALITVQRNACVA